MAELIHRVILRLNEEDFQALKEAAEEENLTVSKYIRKLIQENAVSEY